MVQLPLFTVQKLEEMERRGPSGEDVFPSGGRPIEALSTGMVEPPPNQKQAAPYSIDAPMTFWVLYS